MPEYIRNKAAKIYSLNQFLKPGSSLHHRNLKLSRFFRKMLNFQGSSDPSDAGFEQLVDVWSSHLSVMRFLSEMFRFFQIIEVWLLNITKVWLKNEKFIREKKDNCSISPSKDKLIFCPYENFK